MLAVPTRVLVAGDVHGDVGWFRRLCDLAQQHDCDAILQLGDFGFWPHHPDGARFQGDFQAWGILELDPLRFVGGETSRFADGA